jgi:glycosyltransferase involved in cell wall biosynthesis
MEKSLKRPIRVLFIISALNRGGSETVLVNLVNSLDRNFFIPILCVLYEGALLNEVNKDVLVYKNIARWSGDPNLLISLVKILRLHTPDIVDVFARDLAGLYGRLAAKLAGTEIIIQSLHFGRYKLQQDPKAVIHHWINRLFDSRTSGFVLVSASQREFCKSMGIPENRIFVITNGVDFSNFMPPMRPDRAVLAGLGIENDAPIIIQIGNFRKVKRHDVILEAIKFVKESYPQVRCLLIGDGSMRSELEKKAQQLGVEKNVLFLGTCEQVEKYLQISDLLTITSDAESFSLAILEAMSVGLPVVSTRCGGPEDIVVDQQTGFLVPLGDSLAFAEKIILLLSNPELGKQMGKIGRRRVIDHFSLQDMIEARENLYFDFWDNRE